MPTDTPGPTNTPSPTPNNDPDYFYGSLTVTMDYAGKTINLKPKQNFLLALGQDFTWEVSITPPQILSQNVKITPEVGEQGVFIARAPGVALLRAIGEPVCRQANPPCARPTVLFEITVVIE